MADVSTVRIVNIVSVTQGSNTYKGIRSIDININKGRVMPLLAEGDLYPSGAENVGTPDFPVQTSMTFEQSGTNMLALLSEAKGSLVIVVKKDGGAGNETITIANHQFVANTTPASLQEKSQMRISGVAHATAGSGSTLPISYS